MNPIPKSHDGIPIGKKMNAIEPCGYMRMLENMTPLTAPDAPSALYSGFPRLIWRASRLPQIRLPK